ncbi:MAG: PTS sugar transporter subunit IIA [Deltaproteobacteria bacterium]|nr:PTS sugar transporter subunit IIA [Deltaproteobacteria bacterium]
MKISEILNKDLLIPDLQSKDKRGVLEELAGVLVAQGKLRDLKKVVEVLLEREKLGSTGIGDGIAIPHGKIRDLDGVVASFGRSRQGVDFESIDQKPTHLFFLLVAPENSAGTHLKALARISRLLKYPNFRKRLMEAETREQLYQIISEEDAQY